MMNRHVIPLAILFVLTIAFLAVPVCAGLTITDGEKIISRTGNTSPVITITDPAIGENGTILIDISPMHGVVAKGTFISTNVIVDDTAASAIWTGEVTGDILTLTSTGGPTGVGENVTVTFTGAEGSPWIPDTGGSILSGSLTAARTDTSETAKINVSIQTSLGPGGIMVAPGQKITTTDGTTSMEITVTDAPLCQYDVIVLDVSKLYPLVSSGAIIDANIMINDTAATAVWTGTLDGSTLTLASNGGPTAVGETVTVTFTGATGNPWVRNTFGEQTIPLSLYRMDNYGTADFSFVIEITPPPGGLTVTDGAKIITTEGNTSPVITIADTVIPAGGTITMDISGINPYTASGNLRNANVVVADTAAAATWTSVVSGGILTLTSTIGATAPGENITVTLTGAGGNTWIPNTHGEQTVPLTASRTDTGQAVTISFIIETAPPAGQLVIANFTALPTTEMAPLTVTFTDTSLGSPTSWLWDFGDGTTSQTQYPVHTYSAVGMYTVSLTAANTYGSDTKTGWNYINVLNGDIREARTSIPGLTIANCRGPQTITVDTSVLPADLIPNNSVLEIQPPPDRGFKSITIYAQKGKEFSRNGNLIKGNPSGVHLVSEEIAPPPGYSGYIGTGYLGTVSSFNYSIDLHSYPCNAILSTKIWEGEIPEYNTKLIQVSSPNGAVPIGTAYTAKISKTNIPAGTTAKIHMSVDANWNPSLSGGPGNLFIWRINDEETKGQILPTTYLYTDPVTNIDYYEADSPSGLSTIGLSSFTGSNNPFQIIAFVATSIISQWNNMVPSSSGGGTPVAVQPPATPETNQATPLDPGKTAKIYTNDQGTITQATRLLSNDGHANLSLGLGVVARNSSGKALTSISITRIPDLPAAPPGDGISFAGMAYELQPDGATFSPAIPLSLTIPQSEWGKEYVIQEYDSSTKTWQVLPGRYDPQTGTITAGVSHLCCVALFAQSAELQKAATSEPAGVVSSEPTILIASKSSMSTNIEMYGWVVSSVIRNPVFIVIMVAALALVAYFGWWKRRL